MAENRVTQIVGQALFTTTTAELRLTQIVGELLYTVENGPPDPPLTFRPGAYGVQIID